MRAAEMVRGRTARRIALCVALIGALGLLFLSVPHWRELEWGIVGTYDFVAYWGAARVVLGGGNPYNPAELLAVGQPAAEFVAVLRANLAVRRSAIVVAFLASRVDLSAMGYWGINDAHSFWHAPVLAGFYRRSVGGARALSERPQWAPL